MGEKEITNLLNKILNHHELTIIDGFPVEKGFPYQNYIGVNFNHSSIVSIKLYFSFFSPPPIDLVKQFIPEINNYEKYISYYSSTKERSIENNGITFSLKISESGLFTKGYHFRFDANVVEFPKITSFNCSQNDLLNVGICEEFNSEGSLIKYYYYFNKPYNKERFALRFNKPHLIASDLIEYTESRKFNKIISCNLTKNKFYSKFLKFDSPIAETIDAFFIDKLQLNHDVAHGFYEGGEIEAKYYFKLNKTSEHGSSFNLPENHRFETLNYIQEKLDYELK